MAWILLLHESACNYGKRHVQIQEQAASDTDFDEECIFFKVSHSLAALVGCLQNFLLLTHTKVFQSNVLHQLGCCHGRIQLTLHILCWDCTEWTSKICVMSIAVGV